MLEHSIVITLILKFFRWLNELYEESFFHRLMIKAANGLNILGSGSLWGRALDRGNDTETLISGMFVGLVRIWNKLAVFVAGKMVAVLQNSRVFSYIKNFDHLDSTFLSMGTTFFVTGLLTVVFGIFSQKFSSLIGLVLLFIGIVLMLFSSGVGEIVENSFLYPLLKGIKNLFYPDEEGYDDGN